MTRKNIRRNALPMKITIMSTLAALVGIVGIVVLLLQINSISKQYNKMIYDDYLNIQYMDEISQQLYYHQALVYKYISENNDEERANLLDETNSIKKLLEETLISFGSNTKGSSYENLYHSIYSNTTGYFVNIEHVFTFLDSGDVNTADYYINLAMKNCISNVNKSIDTLNTNVNEDMENAQSSLYMSLQISRLLASFGIIVILIFAIYCIIYSAKTADEMTSVDSLTEVYNYDKLLRFANKLYKKGKLQDYSVISTNIKDFKYINQQFGSSGGDSILREYASNLYPLIGNQDLICRAGGDNFILLVKTDTVNDIANSLAETKVDFRSENTQKEIILKSRCGIYCIATNEEITEALNKASIALNKARFATSHLVYFTEDMVNEMVAEKEVLTDFENALKKEEFQVYYQPKVNMPTGMLCGAEALVRWIKNGVIIPPYKFIPVLENDGAITDLDFYVFDHVCANIEYWLKENIKVVKVSSNFSKLHLKNKNFAEDVLSIIRRHHIDPSYIEVELTESSGYEDFEALSAFISKMKENGISTSMDDFGTGYSSLSMLQDLDVDVVKLDKSFIDHINGDENDEDNIKTRKMVHNVVRMVKDLQRSVICEGIESIEQATFLVETGCTKAQGYLYNKPLPKNEFESILENPQYELIIK